MKEPLTLTLFKIHINIFVYMQTTASKNGALCHDVHYWLGKDTSQVSSLSYLDSKFCQSILFCQKRKIMNFV